MAVRPPFASTPLAFDLLHPRLSYPPETMTDIRYRALVHNVLDRGADVMDRTEVGIRYLLGVTVEYPLSTFPLVTLKKTSFKAVAEELLWFLQGGKADNNNVFQLNSKTLNDRGVHIWDEWAEGNGNLGPIYGSQWRHWGSSELDWDGYARNWGGIDQIKEVIQNITSNPFSRRHIVSAWNVADVPQMALPPCHTLFQFHVEPNEHGEPSTLSCQLYQRSADLFLGVPFNIASYALLTYMVAKQTGLTPGTFYHNMGNAHVYHNHFTQAEELIQRKTGISPTLTISDRAVADISEYTFEDFSLTGYFPQPAIKAPVAV